MRTFALDYLAPAQNQFPTINCQFFLSHGGFTDGFTEYGKVCRRPPTGIAQADVVLPKVPQ